MQQQMLDGERAHARSAVHQCHTQGDALRHARRILILMVVLCDHDLCLAQKARQDGKSLPCPQLAASQLICAKRRSGPGAHASAVVYVCAHCKSSCLATDSSRLHERLVSAAAAATAAVCCMRKRVCAHQHTGRSDRSQPCLQSLPQGGHSASAVWSRPLAD